VYVAGCDLDKSFIFEKTVVGLITSHVRFTIYCTAVNISYIIHDIFPEAWELESFQTAKVTFKVI